MSRKKLIAIISGCVVAVAIGAALPLGLVFGGKSATPVVELEHEKDSFFVVAKWNAVRGASQYFVEYYYGDPAGPELNERAIVRCQTENEETYIPASKGVVAVRCRGEIAGRATEFSEWKTADVAPRVLDAPKVTINDDLSCVYELSEYDTPDGKFAVCEYECGLTVDGAELLVDVPFRFNSSEEAAKSHVGNLVDAISNWLKKDGDESARQSVCAYLDGEEWKDIEIEFEIRALPTVSFAGAILDSSALSENERVLKRMYEPSERFATKKTITKEIFDERLKDKVVEGAKGE